jgi:hypothetical protein
LSSRNLRSTKGHLGQPIASARSRSPQRTFAQSRALNPVALREENPKLHTTDKVVPHLWLAELLIAFVCCLLGIGGGDRDNRMWSGAGVGDQFLLSDYDLLTKRQKEEAGDHSWLSWTG